MFKFVHMSVPSGLNGRSKPTHRKLRVAEGITDPKVAIKQPASIDILGRLKFRFGLYAKFSYQVQDGQKSMSREGLFFRSIQSS